jgi:hypothetical protein
MKITIEVTVGNDKATININDIFYVKESGQGSLIQSTSTAALKCNESYEMVKKMIGRSIRESKGLLLNG